MLLNSLHKPFISLYESDSVNEDGTGERTGGSGKTGCSSFKGVTSLELSAVLGGVLVIPFTLSAQLFPVICGLKDIPKALITT